MNNKWNDELEHAVQSGNIEVLMGYLDEIRTIAGSGDSVAVTALITRLEHSGGLESRAIIQSLPVIPEIEPVLIKILESGYDHVHPWDGMVHIDAVMKLAALRTPAALNAIRKWTADVLQLDETKRFYAFEGLLSLAHANDKSSLPLIRDCLGDSDASIRGAAIEAVHMMQDNESVAKLIELLSDRSENPGVSEVLICDSAAEALGALGDERAIQPIANMIENHQTGIHPVLAIRSLTSFGDVGLEALVKMYNRVDNDLKAEIDRCL